MAARLIPHRDSELLRLGKELRVGKPEGQPLQANSPVERLIADALRYVGSPAVKPSEESADPLNTGNNPKGFSCSGFFQFLLLRSGTPLFVEVLGRNARYTREFFDHVGILVPQGEHKRGDLVFFSYDGAMPTHMGLYLGNNELIHKGFIDTSLVPAEPTGDYRKRIIISQLDIISNDTRNSGNPIRYRPERGPQLYYRNPIGFKRLY